MSPPPREIQPKLILLTTLIFTLALASCGDGLGGNYDSGIIDGGGGTTVAVTGVTLNKTSVNLDVGNIEILTAAVAPANASNKNVYWASSNTAVATVSNGRITATGVGSAVITVTTADGGKTAACTVTVKLPAPDAIPVTGVTLNKTSTSLGIWNSENLTATVTPSNATNKNVSWTSSNTGVAGVSNGYIIAYGTGSAVITVTTADGGKTAMCTVTVPGSDMTWTAVSNSTLGGMNVIAYGNNKFVAGGLNGKMAYSYDGIYWTTVDSTFGASDIYAIAYGGDKFVAVGGNGKMAYSYNGINWTAIPSGYDAGTSTFGIRPIDLIAWGNNRFVALNSSYLAYSSDGINWTQVSFWPPGIPPPPGGPFVGRPNVIAYGNNRFVFITSGNHVYYSLDGASWTMMDSTFGANDIYAIAYGGGKFVAGDLYEKMAYSTDGINWTAVTDSTFDTGRNSAIAYGNNRFVAGVYYYIYSSYPPTLYGGMAYSFDGITWSAVSDSTLSNIRAIAYGNNRFVAVDANGKVAYSLDN
jgi:uncharacterized protein YjdB